MRGKTNVIALTGGIASGKTAVSDRLGALGVPIIDTDLIAREVVAPGEPLLATLVARFGQEILTPDGALDRAAMRQRVFDNDLERRALEGILHPAIVAEAKRRITHVKAPWCVVVIPLLAENTRHEWIDRVLVVDTPAAVQLERVQQRDGVNQQQAQAILNAQASRAQRLAIADDVIVNDGSLADLQSATDRQYASYNTMFSGATPTP